MGVTRRVLLIGAAGHLAFRATRSSGQIRPQPPVILQSSGSFVWAVAVARSGKFAVSGHVDFGQTGGARSGIIIWDLDARRALGKYEANLGVSTVAFSPDESLVLVAGRSNRAKLLHRDDGHVVRELPLRDDRWGHTGAFSEGGAQVILCEAARDNADRPDAVSTKVWNLSTGKVLRSFPRSAASYSRDGKLAIDEGGALWSLRTGRDESRHRPPHDADWTPRALSPDGRLALLSSTSENAGPVGLWEPSAGSKVRRLSGHSALVVTGVFTGDGSRVITGAGEKNKGRQQDCTVRIWDTSSTKELATLRGHEVGVWTVASSANGQRVVSGDGKGRVVLWEISQ
jgi:WD40 repeat protein